MSSPGNSSPREVAVGPCANCILEADLDQKVRRQSQNGGMRLLDLVKQVGTSALGPTAPWLVGPRAHADQLARHCITNLLVTPSLQGQCCVPIPQAGDADAGLPTLDAGPWPNLHGSILSQNVGEQMACSMFTTGRARSSRVEWLHSQHCVKNLHAAQHDAQVGPVRQWQQICYACHTDLPGTCQRSLGTQEHPS